MAHKDIRCFVSRVADPFLNLAIEEWYDIVGRNQNPWKECNVHALSADNVPWVRRKSGGGTVFHDRGNSIYSVIEPREAFTRRKNAELVARALQNLDIPAEVNERHDLVVEGKKVSGSAFKLTNHRAYHHGTMLIDADLPRLRKYLKISRPGLVTKGVPSVPSPVTNLRPYSLTVDHSSFCEAVIDQFRKAHDLGYLKVNKLTETVLDREPKVREAYDELKSDEWRMGQTPEFTHTFELDGTCVINSRSGRITGVSFDPLPGHGHDELFVAGLEDYKQCLLDQWYLPATVHSAWPAFVAMQRGAVTETHPAMVRLRAFTASLAQAL
ncbi:hypothetical protein H9P43_003452 [Blastocladiella emersonii ATCC 22665]|nr:hypothetical protein H9P43_003452 [Blastocladiella emersonii ATCC 22665]